MPHVDDIQVDVVKHSWTEVGQSTAGDPVTVEHAATPGRHHVAVKCDASYDTVGTSGELTVLFDGDVVSRKHIHDAGALDFGVYGLQNPLINTVITATLDGGGGGVLGDVTLTGYSTGPDVGSFTVFPTLIAMQPGAGALTITGLQVELGRIAPATATLTITGIASTLVEA